MPQLAYDLYLRTDSHRFVWRIADHGVRLDGDRIGWTAGGRHRDAALGDIADIHLTRGGGIVTGGGSALPLMRMLVQRPSMYVSICRIRFRYGGELSVLDGDASGLPDSQRAAPYSEFVVRLHERLAARRPISVGFAAGYSLFRYRMLVVLLALLGAMDIGALVAVLSGAGKGNLIVVASASIWFWFQWQMVRQNAPRRYDPARVPDELLPATVDRALPRPSPSAASAAAGDTDAASLIPWPVPSQIWLWALPVPALLAIGTIVWFAAVSESDIMFEPDRARQALAALEREAGETLHLRKLDMLPGELTVMVESSRSHVDRKGFVSHMETWTITHASLFSGWREWERVSGPYKADSLPVLEEAGSKTFVLRPQALPDIPQMGRSAIEHSSIADATVRQMSLVSRFPINPVAGEDLMRWTVRVAAPRESAEISFDHDGRYAGADLAGTIRSSNRNLLAGGEELDDTLQAIRTAIGDGPAIAFMRITPKHILIRTEDKQYEADPQGVVDKTPQAFFCHMVNDLQTGRFSLTAVDRGLLATLQERAREAAPIPGSPVAAVILSAPEPGAAGGSASLQWSIEPAAGHVRVVFDHTGALLGVRARDDRQYCD